MKIYKAHNLDGTLEGVVAAKNLKEAAAAFQTSVYNLQQFGWSYVHDDDTAATAYETPGEPSYRPIMDREAPWMYPRSLARDYAFRRKKAARCPS